MIYLRCKDCYTKVTTADEAWEHHEKAGSRWVRHDEFVAEKDGA